MTNAKFNLDKKDMHWEDLDLMRSEISKDLISQKLILSEVYTAARDILKTNGGLRSQISGLAKSYNDVASDLIENANKHAVMTDGVFVPNKTGEVSDDEDYLKYINIATKYTVCRENIIHLSTTAYIDIFSKINTLVGASVFPKEAISEIQEISELNELKEIKETNE